MCGTVAGTPAGRVADGRCTMSTSDRHHSDEPRRDERDERRGSAVAGEAAVLDRERAAYGGV